MLILYKIKWRIKTKKIYFMYNKNGNVFKETTTDYTDLRYERNL